MHSLAALTGMKIIASDKHALPVYEWRKKPRSKKRRIQNKWRKKYTRTYYEPMDPFHFMQTNTLVMHTRDYHRFKAAWAEHQRKKVRPVTPSPEEEHKLYRTMEAKENMETFLAPKPIASLLDDEPQTSIDKLVHERILKEIMLPSSFQDVCNEIYPVTPHEPKTGAEIIENIMQAKEKLDALRPEPKPLESFMGRPVANFVTKPFDPFEMPPLHIPILKARTSGFTGDYLRHQKEK